MPHRNKAYTKEELIELIKKKKKELKRTPKYFEMDNIAYNTFKKYFGSWNNALKEAELKYNKIKNNYSKEELIKILRSTARRVKRSPTRYDIESPTFTVFRNIFGSWNEALKAAKLKVKQTRECKSKGFKDLSKDQIILLLIGWKSLNNSLTASQIQNDKNIPSPIYIIKKLEVKKWNEVVELVNKYQDNK